MVKRQVAYRMEVEEVEARTKKKKEESVESKQLSPTQQQSPISSVFSVTDLTKSPRARSGAKRR